MEKSINKIMFIGFVSAAFMCGYTIKVLNTLLASSWGPYARIMDSDLINNLMPVGVGVIFLIYAYSSKNIKEWASEVIVEVSKVVWPSRKDTTAMTVFVCIFMLLSGVLLGLFDFFSSQVIQFIIELS